MPYRSLPKNPNLRNVRNQAKTLLDAFRSGDREAVDDFSEFHPQAVSPADTKLTDAQLVLARSYRFSSWPRFQLAVQLVKAIYDSDINHIRELIKAHPELLVEKAASSENWGPPLAYAAQSDRVDVMRCLVDLGADQFDRAFKRASLAGNHRAADFLLAEDKQNEIQLNLLPPCEALNPEGIQYLLDKGANPNYENPDSGTTPLSMLLGGYSLNERRQSCIRLIIEGGATHQENVAFDLLAGRTHRLKDKITETPSLIQAHFSFPEGGPDAIGGSYFGAPLNGATLLHVCAHYNFIEEAILLLEKGADVNARANNSIAGSNHTPIYHAVNSNFNYCYPMAELLVEHGADLAIRSTIRLPLHREQEKIISDATPLAYIYEFPKPPRDIVREDNSKSHEPHPKAVELLTKHGAKI